MNLTKKQLEHKLLQQEKQITQLHVVIDTLQTNLRSAVSYLDAKEMKEVSNHSYRWSMGFKPGDEKKA